MQMNNLAEFLKICPGFSAPNVKGIPFHDTIVKSIFDICT